MNWEHLGTHLLNSIKILGIVIISYYCAKEFISTKRKHKDKKASVGEKITIFFLVIGTCIGLTILINNGNSFEDFVFNLIICIIPATLGVWAGLNRDSKLTNEERQELSNKAMLEKYSNRLNRDDRD